MPGCALSFLLFCDGEASARALRPHDDEGMWRGRLDALARIAAAALSCGACPGEKSQDSAPSRCSLLFVGDGALVQVDEGMQPGTVPTERNLVRCWRRAARDREGRAGDRGAGGEAAEPGLRGAVREVLGQCPSGSVVAILHETEAVPLRIFESGLAPAGRAPPAAVFVLGAVRDMAASEVQLVERTAATDFGFRVLRCCVGREPEFSSKVVRCLAASHSSGLLASALAQALKADRGNLAEAAADESLLISAIAVLPIDSGCLSVDAAVRPQLLEMVQIIVVALWRSQAGNSYRAGAALNDLAQFISEQGGSMYSSQLADFLKVHPEHQRVFKLTSRIRKERCMRQFCEAHPGVFRFDENPSEGPGKTKVCLLKFSRKDPLLHLLFRDGAALTLSTRFVARLIDAGKRAPTERQVLDGLLEELALRRGASPGAGAEEALRRAVSLHRAESTLALRAGCPGARRGIPLLDGEPPAGPPPAGGARWPREVLLLLDARGAAGAEPPAAHGEAVDDLLALARRCCRDHGVPCRAARVASGCPPASFLALVQFMKYSGCLRGKLSGCRARVYAEFNKLFQPGGLKTFIQQYPEFDSEPKGANGIIIIWAHGGALQDVPPVAPGLASATDRVAPVAPGSASHWLRAELPTHAEAVAADHSDAPNTLKGSQSRFPPPWRLKCGA
ncbi:unnamed protein product [Prorocentrum cordatum]|uniref:Uncharacterized protein n=1 Tax=Prorocentrum cordatum TaxID=2364126 RepID=A0ABN9TST3_9DINO|nr:unnamed protein product [Polarella glacialis]